MAAIKLNEENFEAEVIQASGLVLVDFYADWCGPCKMLAPVIDKISEEQKDVKVCKVNTDEATKLVVKYRIGSIPTLIIFRDGEPVKTSMGMVSKSELEKMLADVRK